MRTRLLVLRVPASLRRARVPILSLAAIQGSLVLGGALAVREGNRIATLDRDSVMTRVRTDDVAARASRQGRVLEAVLIDFSHSLLLEAAPDTVTGLTVVLPYAWAAHRGWIGGIVFADGRSRGRPPVTVAQPVWDLLALALRLLAHSLAGGAGVSMGLAVFRVRPPSEDARWFGVPREAVLDALALYVVVAPVLLAASMCEFLTP